jgi:hypothetical protein
MRTVPAYAHSLSVRNPGTAIANGRGTVAHAKDVGDRVAQVVQLGLDPVDRREVPRRLGDQLEDDDGGGGEP